MLIDGKWSGPWHPFQAADDKGRFLRQNAPFRRWITPDGRPGPEGQEAFPAEAGRYHLYVALICPWATRALIARALKGLEEVVSFSITAPFLTDEGWRFGGYPGATEDHVNGFEHVHQLYTKADPHFTGRATVPVLWDKRTGTIVNNESADILRIFDKGFGDLEAMHTSCAPRLWPPRSTRWPARCMNGSTTASIARVSLRVRKPMTKPTGTSLPCSTRWTRGLPTGGAG